MIKKIIPSRIKKLFYNTIKEHYNFPDYAENYVRFQQEFLEARKLNEAEIPSVDLKQKHIENIKILLDRKELLRHLPKNVVCAEIGVDRGDFSKSILELTHPKKLHLIDAWGDETRYHDGLKLIVQERFSVEIANGVIEINKGLSTEILKNFPDEYFDWIYLDTNHTYSVTADELNILKYKVKANGIIAGHDYIIGNWVGDCRYGVIEAVHELCVRENWELLFVTINKNEMPSFAIRRIQ